MKKWGIGIVSVLFVAAATAGAQAEVGVTAAEIVIGQSAALDGPAKELGLGMQAGMKICFDAVNEQGGVNGRKIRLVSYDDGYEPARCAENTKKLVQEAFVLAGYVGTPTSVEAVPIAEENKVPFIGAFTGAEFLSNPIKKYVFNVRGSYYDETEGLVVHLIGDRQIMSIACFYQNDAYGQAGLQGVQRALDRRGLSLVAEGTYERNTTNVAEGLAKINAANPEAVIMIGAYAPCAEFIKQAKSGGMDKVLFCNISFVGSEALRSALGSAGDGVFISQVVPFPWDTSVGLVREYGAVLAKYAPDRKEDFITLEGYMVGRFLVEAIKACGADLSREKMVSTIESVRRFSLGGVGLTFSETDHQGMDRI
ncbi:MAG: ABC transporter substrate-binding protein, partial [Candidatus Omnitrophica bacterium]|nr:ABC transporter substrate-binding protein [Candidatus Omnitrophota bacterium]